MSLVSKLAGGHVSHAPRLSIEQLGPIVPGRRCHAGAGHTEAAPCGPFGDLCAACWTAVQAIVLRARGTAAGRHRVA